MNDVDFLRSEDKVERDLVKRAHEISYEDLISEVDYFIQLAKDICREKEGERFATSDVSSQELSQTSIS